MAQDPIRCDAKNTLGSSKNRAIARSDLCCAAACQKMGKGGKGRGNQYYNQYSDGYNNAPYQGRPYYQRSYQQPQQSGGMQGSFSDVTNSMKWCLNECKNFGEIAKIGTIWQKVEDATNANNQQSQ
eukprot:111308-Karenia_brevis.AAC.1